MDQFVSDTAISPLRQRMIDDMNLRRFGPDTQRNYLRDVERLPASSAVRLKQRRQMIYAVFKSGSKVKVLRFKPPSVA